MPRLLNTKLNSVFEKYSSLSGEDRTSLKEDVISTVTNCEKQLLRSHHETQRLAAQAMAEESEATIGNKGSPTALNYFRASSDVDWTPIQRAPGRYSFPPLTDASADMYSSSPISQPAWPSNLRIPTSSGSFPAQRPYIPRLPSSSAGNALEFLSPCGNQCQDRISETCVGLWNKSSHEFGPGLGSP